MPKRLTVVISQGQSQHPAKRELEESLVAALMMEPGIDVTVIPHLYDLKPDGTGMLCLQGISGDLLVFSWLYPRACRWILDRNNIRGREGLSLIKSPGEDDAADDDETDEAEADGDGEDGTEAATDKTRVIENRPPPNRRIYCLDLRAVDKAEPFIAEVKRIFAELQTTVVELGGFNGANGGSNGNTLLGWIGGTPAPAAMQRFSIPTNDTALGGAALGGADNASIVPTIAQAAITPTIQNGVNQNGATENTVTDLREPIRVQEEGGRRWYPVIDYSRCTNCMECIDFCLFGVYGVDRVETILVEQPDNCRKGCPACSRVCPENAIIFPQHKTPGIAGSAVIEAGGLKIDLSQLFGAPSGESAEVIAARERDEQLLLAGRQAVGLSVGMPKRQAEKPKGPKDELDQLLDKLDDLDL